MALSYLQINIKRVLQGLFLLGAFFLVGCALSSDSESEQLSSSRQESARMFSTAVEQADLASCDEILLPNIKSFCIGEVVAQQSLTKKENLCLSLDDDLALESCQKKLFTIINSSEALDLDQCALLESADQPDCFDRVYLQEAIQSRDAGACDKLQFEDLQDQCRFEIVYESVQSADDSQLCLGLSSVQLQDICRNAYQIDIYMEKALEESDPTICDQLAQYEQTGSTLVGDCRDQLDLLESSGSGSVDLVETATAAIVIDVDPDLSADMGWIDQATAESDLRVCEKIKDEDRRMSCIDILIRSSFLRDQPPSCQLLTEAENRSYCDVGSLNLKSTLEQAIATSDADLCQTLPRGIDTMSGYVEGLRDKCMTSIYGESVPEIVRLDQLSETITARLDERKCSDISNLTYRKFCMKSVIVDEAVARQSADACDVFISEGDQTECRLDYQKSTIISEAIDQKDPKICEQLDSIDPELTKYCQSQINHP